MGNVEAETTAMLAGPCFALKVRLEQLFRIAAFGFRTALGLGPRGEQDQ
jgi:hypothetical protein